MRFELKTLKASFQQQLASNHMTQMFQDKWTQLMSNIILTTRQVLSIKVLQLLVDICMHYNKMFYLLLLVIFLHFLMCWSLASTVYFKFLLKFTIISFTLNSFWIACFLLSTSSWYPRSYIRSLCRLLTHLRPASKFQGGLIPPHPSVYVTAPPEVIHQSLTD